MEYTPDGQKSSGESFVPKPFDAKDEVRVAELEKKFVPDLKNDYEVDKVKVEITGKTIVNKVNREDDPSLSYVGQKRDEYTVEFPVTITDPNAPGIFKNVGRWSKYVLTIDKISGDVTHSSRVDRRFDEKLSDYFFDGPTYQIHTPEVEELLRTKAVSDAVHYIKSIQ